MCPTWKWAVVWGLREMGSAWKRGARVDPDHQKGGKKQSMPNKGMDNMGKDEEDQSSQKCWRRIGANRVSSL